MSFDRTPSVPGERVLKEGVELELVRFGSPTPATSRPIASLLREWTLETKTDVGQPAEFVPFSLPVLAVERTLADKLCIAHRLATERQKDPGRPLAGQVRHYYDIGMMLDSLEVVRTLQSEPGLIARYAAEAHASSEQHRRQSVARPAGGFADSPAFTDANYLRAVTAEYDRELGMLRLGLVPPLERVLQLVEQHRVLL